jgi:hypothetical protein
VRDGGELRDFFLSVTFLFSFLSSSQKANSTFTTGKTQAK